jgi:drug/metabolite transporter (DMT)-like permease
MFFCCGKKAQAKKNNYLRGLLKNQGHGDETVVAVSVTQGNFLANNFPAQYTIEQTGPASGADGIRNNPRRKGFSCLFPFRFIFLLPAGGQRNPGKRWTKEQMTGRQDLGAALVLFSALCLSTEAIAAKIAYRGGATVLTVLTLRYLLAAAVFWLLLLAGGRPYRLPRRQLLAVTALSLGTQTLTVLALFESFRYIPAAMAILFLYFFPAVVTVLAFIFLKEPVTGQKVLALFLTFLGCATILGQPEKFGALDPRGVALALAAALTNGVFVVGSARLLAGIPTLVYSTYVSTIVALAAGGLALLRGQLSLAFDWRALAAVGELGLVATVLAMWAFYRGVKEIGASRAAIVSTFEPVATAVLGYLVLGEGLTAWQMAGGAAVLAGVLLQRLELSHQPRE